MGLCITKIKKACITKISKENGQSLCASITNMQHLKYLSVCSLSEYEMMDLQYMSHPALFLSTLYLHGCLKELFN